MHWKYPQKVSRVWKKRKIFLPVLICLISIMSIVGCASETGTYTTQEISKEVLQEETSSAEIVEEQQTETEPDDWLDPEGTYTSKEDVARYIYLYGELPRNFITKKEAENLGWSGGSLEKYAPGKCIGGSRFGNYEELLPEADGRKYFECDIDTLGAGSRGAKRIVYSNDGLIYYTDDHYESFELLYGEEER